MEKQKVTINANVENLSKLKELLSEVETLKAKFDIELTVNYREVNYVDITCSNDPNDMPTFDSIYPSTKNDTSQEES